MYIKPRLSRFGIRTMRITIYLHGRARCSHLLDENAFHLLEGRYISYNLVGEQLSGLVGEREIGLLRAFGFQSSTASVDANLVPIPNRARTYKLPDHVRLVCYRDEV